MTLPSITKLQRVYPLTDRDLTGLSHAEQTAALVSGGSRFIQLREKELTAGEMLEDVRNAVEVAHRAGAVIIINDRVDIALITGAGGVHLGQGDLPPAEARKILGPEALIGYSTHDLEQARLALEEPIDYIAFGPVFPTATKKDHDPITGIDLLRQARHLVSTMPLVAIGGIGAESLHRVLSAGADSAAMISGVLEPAAEIAQNIERLLALADDRGP